MFIQRCVAKWQLNELENTYTETPKEENLNKLRKHKLDMSGITNKKAPFLIQQDMTTLNIITNQGNILQISFNKRRKENSSQL